MVIEYTKEECKADTYAAQAIDLLRAQARMRGYVTRADADEAVETVARVLAATFARARMPKL